MVNEPSLTEAEIERLVAETASHLTQPVHEVGVSFVDEPTIQTVNRERRGKDRPTDVLSFPFDDDFPHGAGGEVLICVPVAERQAAERSIPVRDELAMLLVHGVLHVYGMEDETANGAATMEQATRAILKAAWFATSE